MGSPTARAGLRRRHTINGAKVPFERHDCFCSETLNNRGKPDTKTFWVDPPSTIVQAQCTRACCFYEVVGVVAYGDTDIYEPDEPYLTSMVVMAWERVGIVEVRAQARRWWRCSKLRV